MGPRRASRENGGARSWHRTIACVACGADHPWCDRCHRAICQHIEAADTPQWTGPEPVAACLDKRKAFVAWVLGEISGEARLVELTDTPEGTDALRVEVPGEVPKGDEMSLGLSRTVSESRP